MPMFFLLLRNARGTAIPILMATRDSFVSRGTLKKQSKPRTKEHESSLSKKKKKKQFVMDERKALPFFQCFTVSFFSFPFASRRQGLDACFLFLFAFISRVRECFLRKSTPELSIVQGIVAKKKKRKLLFLYSLLSRRSAVEHSFPFLSLGTASFLPIRALFSRLPWERPRRLASLPR
jgi:hypothetical protein